MATLATLTIDLVGQSAHLRSELERANRSTRRWASQTRRQTRHVSRQFDSVGDSAKKLSGTLAGLFTAIGAGAGIDAAIKGYAEFESALVGVGKTANLGSEILTSFGKTIQNLSFKIPLSAVELLDISEAAAQLGVTGTKNLEKFAETMARLGASSDLGGADAAKILARILTVTGDGVETIDRFGSVLVALGNQFAASESEIAGMTNEVSRSTAIFDVSASKAAAMSVALKSLGVQAELGGSVVGRAFRAIDASIRVGGDQLQRLSQVTGIAANQLKKAFAEDSTRVFQRFVEGIGALEKQGKSSTAVLELFGLKGEEVLKVLPVLAKNSEHLGSALKIAAIEVNNATALLTESDKAFATLSSDLIRAENAVNNLGIALGSSLAPSLSLASKQFTEFVGDADGAENVVSDLKVAVQTVAIVLAGRLVSGFGAAALAQLQYYRQLAAGNVITLNSAVAMRERARQAMRLAESERIRAALTVQSTQLDVQNATSAQARTVAQDRLTLATHNLSVATTRATTATTAHSVAQSRAVLSTRILTAASTGLRSVMSFLGGPVGVIALAAFALYQFVNSANKAKVSTEDLVTQLRELRGEGAAINLEGKMKALNAQLIQAESQLKTLKDNRINIEIQKPSSSVYFGEILPKEFKIERADQRIKEEEQRISVIKESIAEIKSQLTELNTPTNIKQPPIGLTDLITSKNSLLDEYKKRKESLEKEITLFSDVSRSAQVRYEVEKGSLQGLSEAKANTLISSALELDALEKQKNKTLEISKVRQSLLTQEERLEQAYLQRRLIIVRNTEAESEDRKTLLARLNDDLLKNTLEFEAKRGSIEAQAALERRRVAKLSGDLQVKNEIDRLKTMTASVAQGSKTMFRINKALSIASIAVATPRAVAGAFAAGAEIGGPYLGAAYAAIAAAAQLAQLRQAKAATFTGNGTGTTPSSVGTTPVINDQPVPVANTQSTPSESQQRGTVINIYGDISGNDSEKIFEELKTLINEGDHVLIESTSLNGQELVA